MVVKLPGQPMRACLTYSAADTGTERRGPHVLLLIAGIVYDHWSHFTLPDTLLTLKLSVFSPRQYAPQMQGYSLAHCHTLTQHLVHIGQSKKYLLLFIELNCVERL